VFFMLDRRKRVSKDLHRGLASAVVSRNARVAPKDATDLAALPQQAQDFRRRARIVDATVREMAEHGYGQATVAAIAERAGVSRRAFYTIFSGKDDALIWAYDAAAAYAMPQILHALRAERDWERGTAAALATYLAILDCDHAWALACLREVPAAGERVRVARDAVRAPLLAALQERIASAATAGVGVGTVVTALDAIAVDGLRHRPEQPLWERRQELASFALAPFADGVPTAVSTDVAAVSQPPDRGLIEALVAKGPAGRAELELLVRAAIARRDGPTLWQAVVQLQRRRAASGSPEDDDLIAEALDALGDAWFFGLPIAEPGAGGAVAGISETDTLYLRYVAAHPDSSGEQIRRGLAVAHLSQVNRTLQRLEGHGVVAREPGPGRANAWRLTAAGVAATRAASRG
jgi:AcrR family transcriptional regulator